MGMTEHWVQIYSNQKEINYISPFNIKGSVETRPQLPSYTIDSNSLPASMGLPPPSCARFCDTRISNFALLKAREIRYNNLEISLVISLPNITSNHAITMLIIYMKKFIHCDWLREMQFSGNTVQKKGNLLQKRVTNVTF